MTFVKYFLAEIITNLFCCNRKHLERALGYQFPALATLIYVDSGIAPLTDRSMVRRELYRLKAWITESCAYIVIS